MVPMYGSANVLVDSLGWALGFSWLGVRYIQALRATSRLKHEGTGPVPSDWETRFRLWVGRLGADPPAIILQSSRITTPLTIGPMHPSASPVNPKPPCRSPADNQSAGRIQS